MSCHHAAAFLPQRYPDALFVNEDLCPTLSSWMRICGGCRVRGPTGEKPHNGRGSHRTASRCRPGDSAAQYRRGRTQLSECCEPRRAPHCSTPPHHHADGRRLRRDHTHRRTWRRARDDSPRDEHGALHAGVPFPKWRVRYGDWCGRHAPGVFVLNTWRTGCSRQSSTTRSSAAGSRGGRRQRAPH